jgi:hypothetical protein
MRSTFALVVDDGLAPVLTYDAVHGHLVRGVVEAGLAVDLGIRLQQLQRLHSPAGRPCCCT